MKVLKQPLSASFCFPSPPLTPPHGLREVLAIWMLLLHCERSLIASALPTASQTSQRGALAACLISHHLDVIHCEKRERGNKGKRRAWLEKRARSGGCRRAAGASSSLQPRHLFSVTLQLGAVFSSQSGTINGALSRTSPRPLFT